jgi:Ca2+/Na+ antiporter
MIQNIFLIVLVIILFFLISNEKKIDQLINKKYIKYLFILFIVYFIYQNYNFGIFVFILIVFILFNTDLKKKLEQNKYLNLEKYTNLYTNLAKEYFSNMNDNNYNNSNCSNNSSYEVKPYKEEIVRDENNELQNKLQNEFQSLLSTDNKKSKKTIEPFKEEVEKLKEMYDNIKSEINKLG